MKKIIILLSLLLPLIVSAGSSTNDRLEKYVNEKQAEISKLTTSGDKCKGNEGKENLNSDFLHFEIDNPSIDAVISSFYNQFRGNYCYKRDYENLKKLEVLSTKARFNLIKYCGSNEDKDKINKIRKEVKDKINNFGTRSNDYFWNEGLYGESNSKNNCTEDIGGTIKEKIKKLTGKFSTGSVLNVVSFKESISDEQINKNADARAKSWIQRNVDSYVSGLGLKAGFVNGSGFHIVDSVKKSFQNGKNFTLKLYNDIENLKNKFIPGEEVKELLKRENDLASKQVVEKQNVKILEEKYSINILDESSSDLIIDELSLLEKSIILSNGDKKELKLIFKKTNNEELNKLPTLRKFISTVIKFLENHNTKENTIPSLEFDDY